MVQTLGWQMILGVIKTPETVRVVKGCPGNKKNMDWHMRAKIKKNRVFGTSEAEAGQKKKKEYWLAESLDNHREINLIDIFPVTGVGRRGKNTPIWYWMYIKKKKRTITPKNRKRVCLYCYTVAPLGAAAGRVLGKYHCLKLSTACDAAIRFKLKR